MATVSHNPALDDKPSMNPQEYVVEGKGGNEETVVDPAVHKSLLRKLDYRMMPVFFVMYFLNHCKSLVRCTRITSIEARLTLAQGIATGSPKRASMASRNIWG